MVPDEWEHGSRAALVSYSSGNIINMLVIGFKLVAGAIASTTTIVTCNPAEYINISHYCGCPYA